VRRRSGGITAIFGLRTPILMQAFFDPNKGKKEGPPDISALRPLAFLL